MRPGSLYLVAAGIIVLASASSAPAGPPGDGAPRTVSLVDVRYDGALDITSEVAVGTARVSLPFGAIWDGRRYTAMEVGPGWARLVPSLEPVGISASSGGESHIPPPGPRFDVLAGPVSQGPRARVLWSADAFRIALRWHDLRVEGVPAPLTVEMVLDRLNGVRYQYLQVHALAPLLRGPESPGGVAGVRSGVSGPGRVRILDEGEPRGPFTLRNGLALEVPRPDPRIELPQYAEGPPPPGCVSPTEDWCETAEGTGLDSRILLDTRWEDNPLDAWPTWTYGGAWHRIDYQTCLPGASADPGNSAYMGDDLSCGYPGGMRDVLSTPVITGVTDDCWFTFGSRYAVSNAGDLGSILLNGFPQWSMPTLPDPDSWYTFNPLSLAGAGPDVTLGFEFASAGSGGPGWMVDDILVYCENGANWRCVNNARYMDGDPILADCSDTVLDNWAFNERAFCVDCPYTFYALVECGAEMHLPLSDMEGAAITITEVVTSTNPALTCRNAAWSDPATPVYPGNCGCASWRGAPWSASDPDGSLLWGFDALPEPCPTWAVYDTAGDGLDCTDLPPCDAVMDRISPGDEQGMDCFIEGDPGLCGIYRIDIRSGGNVWNLFANCTGNTESEFEIYTDCEEAWTAYNPLPELAVANVIETGTCPDTQIQFEVQNLGCVDFTGDLLIRAGTTCAGGDPADWIITGGLAANSSRIEVRDYTVSCTPAILTLQVDPDGLIAECSENPNAATCSFIPGSDSLQMNLCECNASLEVSAGSDVAVCEGADPTLQATVVDSTGCFDTIEYRWIDPTFNVIRDWDPDPNVTLTNLACPSTGIYRVQARCNSALCEDDDLVEVRCDLRPDLSNASADQACVGQETTLDCGSAAPGFTWNWDFEDDGTFDATGCTVGHAYPLVGSYTARLEATAGPACTEQTTVPVSVFPNPELPQELRLFAERATGGGLRIFWSGVPGAVTYRVTRGPIGAFAEHQAEPADGAGSCDTLGATSVTDPDDAGDGNSWFYLGVPLNGCGTEGAWGLDSNGEPRAGRTVTAGCP